MAIRVIHETKMHILHRIQLAMDHNQSIQFPQFIILHL